ncbi:ABC transporter permease [Enterococcus sp. 669A]|uniref:ABC transporter permease n=1 Tax=Candidatus Enterococcus moelleringii TaxID=2815325 RepID=A0ABS3L6E8_9ENTE|nr:ABC transporter permease [Enterococcus sp. 669A]MBO1305182.1 ABC transporter permease [Enterococcus sp. 669A]
MRKYILWRTAFRSIFKNKRRSLLTMFGIIIGIAAVITIVALGNGFKRNILSTTAGVDESGQTQYINIKYNDFDNMLTDETGISQTDKSMVANLPEVKDVSYYKAMKTDGNPSVDFYDKNTKFTMTVKATDQTSLPIITGRQLNLADNDGLNKVVVLDEAVAKQVYGSAENAMGKGFELKGQVFTVVGVSTNTSGEIGLQNYEPLAFFPKKTYTRYFGKKEDHSTLAIKFTPQADQAAAMSKVLKQLNVNGESRQQGEYQAYDPASEIKQLGSTLDQMTMFIGAVAAISLFIAGVGVMNMMYISVSERTKEIGIRRALGANAKSIKQQFLFEGIVLTLSGGVIGYILGILIAYAASLALPFSVRPDLTTVLISVGTSVLIGVCFSYLPASAAAKKELIDILK